VKKRLDVLLTERGLAVSRTQAQAFIMAGLVPGYDKPGQQVDEDAELSVVRGPAYVSRGGEKLAHALDELGVDPSGLDVLDLGASTGGFTDVLLQRGASRVIAVDVGYGQLHPKIRDDPRVVVLERTNARALSELPFEPQLIVCDVSFISVRTALPPALLLAAPDWQAVVLVTRRRTVPWTTSASCASASASPRPRAAGRSTSSMRRTCSPRRRGTPS
jgi:23S rRNA (cytidine1920-2'-O)/16S rRNA (cytidine1409-2'-O)-methyltransferase